VTPAGVGYGLVTAASWGSSDFLGGTVSRRTTPLATVVPSQAVGLAIIAVILVVVREPVPPIAALAWAAVAGCGGFFALTTLYMALTTGAMGLVASAAALVGAGVPVIVGAFFGDQLTALDIAGIVLALIAIVLVTRPAEASVLSRAGLLLAVGSGIGASCFYLAMGASEHAGGGTWWPLAMSHVSGLALAIPFLARNGGLAWIPRNLLPTMLALGLTDVAGAAFFLLAVNQGSVGIAAVVGSQHPAATTILARVITKEHLGRSQIAGILLALVAIALIALP
jgi:drug/metabolite transporter (DMT)-like permease